MFITGIVLRSKSKETTATFYSKLGIKLREHSHGGPLHYECVDFSDNSVFEIYQKSEAYPKDALMIEVDSLEKALQMLNTLGMPPKNEIKETSGLKFLYCLDPDDRLIMLIEKNHGIHTY